jgi:N-acetylglucosamine kinase-like BadF-type ATPase
VLTILYYRKKILRREVLSLLYTIGIDGGGTKTEAAAVGEDGAELASCTGGASNAFAVGFDGALSAVRELLGRLWHESGLAPDDCAGIGIALAGAGREEDRRAWREALIPYVRERGAAGPVVVRSDAEAALIAGLGRREGAVVISGTGSIVYGVTADGEELRVGGWGHLLGDAGSGYMIGLHALRAVMDSCDGVRPPTLLTGMALQHAILSAPPEFKDYVYAPHRKKQDIAAFARICMEAAGLGDPAAVAIIRREAGALAEQAATLLRRHPPFAEGAVALSGSIFAKSPLFRSAFEAALRTDASTKLQLVPPTRSAAHGAAAMIYYDLKETST